LQRLADLALSKPRTAYFNHLHVLIASVTVVAFIPRQAPVATGTGPVALNGSCRGPTNEASCSGIAAFVSKADLRRVGAYVARAGEAHLKSCLRSLFVIGRGRNEWRSCSAPPPKHAGDAYGALMYVCVWPIFPTMKLLP
jgi:hypothetical protein